MPVTREDVKHIAVLARLKVKESEIDSLTGQLNEILNYMDKLNQLDTKNVEPLSHPVEIKKGDRSDEIIPSIDRDLALSNAPSQDRTFFGVPKVIKSS